MLEVQNFSPDKRENYGPLKLVEIAKEVPVIKQAREALKDLFDAVEAK